MLTVLIEIAESMRGISPRRPGVTSPRLHTRLRTAQFWSSKWKSFTRPISPSDAPSLSSKRFSTVRSIHHSVSTLALKLEISNWGLFSAQTGVFSALLDAHDRPREARTGQEQLIRDLPSGNEG